MKTRVALVKCSEYKPADLRRAIEKILAELGGVQRFFSAGRTVLIKPNLLSGKAPEQAVTTHPEVVRAIIRIVKACGGKPMVGDSTCSALKIERVWDKTGFRGLCREEAVPLLNLEKCGSRRFDFQGIPFSVANPVFEADLVINVPKLKTHSFMVFTNAVKNVYGTMPGYQKTMLHKTCLHPERFGEFLAYLYGIVKPGLTICDAVTAMEGDGPAAGTIVNLGCLAGSVDGIALDVVLCRLLKVDVDIVPYLKSLKNSAVGQSEWSMIELAGDSPRLLSLPPLRLPGASVIKLVPSWLVKLLGPAVWIRPFISDQCTACGTCVKACPVNALSCDGAKRPVLDTRKCIECCCCHEVCPEKAIKMRESPLLRMVARGKLLP